MHLHFVDFVDRGELVQAHRVVRVDRRLLIHVRRALQRVRFLVLQGRRGALTQSCRQVAVELFALGVGVRLVRLRVAVDADVRFQELPHFVVLLSLLCGGPAQLLRLFDQVRFLHRD